MSTDKPLPPTAEALLRALRDAGGSLPYRDARVTTSGLTALRHRGLARVQSYPLPIAGTRVEWTDAGRERAASLVTP